jgi:uncharacterized caspase-like protein
MLALAWPADAWCQGDGYWLITKVEGHWEYRTATSPPRRLTGEYDEIRKTGQVRCLDPDVSGCELHYLVAPRTDETKPLGVVLAQSGRWVSLRNLTPPPPPVLAATSTELAAKYTRVTRAGGSRAASACGGDLPLSAPACGEQVDVSAFVVHWPAREQTVSGTLTVIVETVDGERALFRGKSEAVTGQYGSSELTGFLRRIQRPGTPVDVTVRVLAAGGRSAVRLVHVPPTARTGEFEARVRALGALAAVPRSLGIMSLALDEGMWSRAAIEARGLIAVGGRSPRLLESALAGLCQSDFEDERAALRKTMPPARFEEICALAAAPGVTDAAPAAATSEPDAAMPAPAPARPGIALVIGNWNYWDTPLNSVRSDVQNLRAALEARGFLTTAKENLRTPRQFAEALDATLREHDATPEDTLLVYYSGHGLQLDGKAHLLGTGASAGARVAEDLRDNAQSAEDLVAQMERSIPSQRILIVEACRDEVFSSRSGLTQSGRGGFAFQQDDVANTFVMFANRPGATTAVRSDEGLMGPFTEALLQALQTGTGEIQEVFEAARRMAMDMSPGQEPVLYKSKVAEPVFLGHGDPDNQDRRARDLLNSAEPLYRARSWEAFRASVKRGRVLATGATLQRRLASEVEFAERILAAEVDESAARWPEAAANWEKAARLFPARPWVQLRSAIAWLIADDVARAMRPLTVVARQAEESLAEQARVMSAALVKAFPALEAEATLDAEAPAPPAGPEFELVEPEE